MRSFRGHLETTSEANGATPPPADADPVQLQVQLTEFYLGQAGYRATPLSSEAPGGRARPPTRIAEDQPAPRADTGLARLCTVQAAQLAVLAGTAEALARHEKPSGVLADVLATCLDMAAISRGVLYVVGREGRLELREHVGFPASALDRLQTCFGHEGRLLELLVSPRVSTIPSGDVGSDMTADLLGQFGVASMLVVPVMWGNALQGALLLGAPRTDASAEESVAFARVLGLQVAQAIALARTFDRMSQAEHRYRMLMEGAHDAVAVLTPDGRILQVNRHCEEILQMPRSEIEGRHVRDFTLPLNQDRHVAEFLTSIDADKTSQAAFALRRADGATILLEISSAGLDIAGERLVLAIGRDVTEQVRGREQRMLSDRLASVGMLASGVAHEINNPLAAVVTNLELAGRRVAALARRHGPLDDLQEEIADARGAAERVRLIVRDLATFAREDEGGQGPVDVRAVLESALRMSRNEVRHRARLICQYSEVPRVLANESRLGQLFLNLVVNAAQSIPEGQADRNRISLSLGTDPSGWVVVEIGDTGAGMTPEVLARLFTPFFTTKGVGEGTGLGLAICQRIVADAGGEITVRSEVGSGTTFRVRLPPAESPIVVRATSTPPRMDRRRGRLLIIDDDPLVMRSLRRVLAEDYDVTAFPDATAALDLIVGGARFDVILSDLVMPKMTGMDLHAALAALVPEQADRMVFLTGGAFTASARAFLEASPNRHVEKPIDGRMLKTLLRDRMTAAQG